MCNTFFSFINFMFLCLCILTSIFLGMYSHLSFIFTCIYHYLLFSKKQEKYCPLNTYFLACFPSAFISYFPILNYSYLLSFPKALHMFLIFVTYKILSQWQVSVLIISESNHNVRSMELNAFHLVGSNQYLMSEWISLFSYPLLHFFTFLALFESPCLIR